MNNSKTILSILLSLFDLQIKSIRNVKVTEFIHSASPGFMVL